MSGFTYGADSSSPYFLDPEPRAPPPPDRPPFYAMNSKVRTAYYALALTSSILTIVAAAGQLFTKSKCKAFANSKDETIARLFEVVAGFALALAVIVAIGSIYALITKMGQGVYAETKTEKSDRIGKSDLQHYADFTMTGL